MNVREITTLKAEIWIQKKIWIFNSEIRIYNKCRV